MKKLTTLMILSLALVPNFAKAELNDQQRGAITGAVSTAGACAAGAMSSVALRLSGAKLYSPAQGCIGGAAINIGAYVVMGVALAQEAPSQGALEEINAGSEPQDVPVENQGE